MQGDASLETDRARTDSETPSPQPGAWTFNWQSLAVVAAGVALVMALLALASIIDWPERVSDERASAGSGNGGSGSIFTPGDPGRINTGSGSGGSGSGSGSGGGGGSGSIRLKPIPGCPNGFELNDNVLIIPDPEACGYRRVPPGTQGVESGKIILVPDVDGDVGGFRLDENGDIDLVPPGEVRGDDFVLRELPDGSFNLGLPDGSELEIAPGDDCLSLRDRIGGDTRFVPAPGAGSGCEDAASEGFGSQGSASEGSGSQGSGSEGSIPGGSNSLGENAPGFDSGGTDSEDAERSTPDRSTPDRPDDTEYSINAALIVLVVLAMLIAALVAASRRGVLRQADTQGEIGEDDLVDATEPDDHESRLAEYWGEINALDRLLWEIDQEPDPRRAIRRVYAALETGLDNPMMARRSAETPGRFIDRILGHFDDLTGPLRELTSLFEHARFSEHEITHDMRNRAVTILVQVRDYYAHMTQQAQQAQQHEMVDV